MFDPKLVKMILIVVLSGAAGSIFALLPILFGKKDEKTGYGTTAGVGFLIGASLGGLFGIFAVLLNQI